MPESIWANEFLPCCSLYAYSMYLFIFIFLEIKKAIKNDIDKDGLKSNKKYITYFALFTFIPSLLISIFSLFLFSACSTLKKSSSSALPYKSNTFLVKKSQQNNLNYQWFSAKMSGTVFVNEKAIPLNANIRMQKDSVIWISATALLI